MFRAICLLLAATAIILAVVWYRTRDRRVLYGFGGTLGLLLVLLLGSWLVRHFGGESDADKVKRLPGSMAKAYSAGDIEATFQPVSESFEMGSTTKAILRRFAEGARERGEVTHIRVWNEQEPQIVPAKDGQPATATIRFSVKPVGLEGESQQFWDCEAVFVKEADGQWRLKSFQLFLPGRKEPYPIPQLPN